jgi:rhodanese-related sulfurtransferase
MNATITREELKSMIERGNRFYLLEIGPEEAYLSTHIMGAINLPPDMIEILIRHLIPQFDAEIVFYCADIKCPQASAAGRKLAEIGYTNVRELIAGKQGWLQAGLPIAYEYKYFRHSAGGRT